MPTDPQNPIELADQWIEQLGKYAVGDPEWTEAVEALHELGFFVVPKLIDALDSADSSTRRGITKALHRMGPMVLYDVIDALAHDSLTVRSEPDAILLSHGHMDHTGFLGHTRPEIPVHATKGTSKMMQAGGIFARQVEIPKGRHRKLLPGKTRRIGDLRVTTFFVDHSAYGSAAFLVEGDGKAILYSGDIRLHGRKTGMAKTLLAALRDKTIDVLLMEGTLLGSSRPKGVNEYELEKKIAEYVSSTDGLVLASFSPQHVDRLVAFIRAAQRTHRIFVADVYTAYILHLIQNETKTPPPISSEGIRVFYPQYFLASYERKRLQKVHDMFLADQITLEEITADPLKHLMVFRASMLDSDFGGQLPSGSRCLFSRWEGYLDQPDWKTTRERIEAAGGDLIHIHTSGHAFVEDLRTFVNEIAPKKMIPIHTFDPGEFRSLCDRVESIADGQEYQID